MKFRTLCLFAIIIFSTFSSSARSFNSDTVITSRYWIGGGSYNASPHSAFFGHSGGGYSPSHLYSSSESISELYNTCIGLYSGYYLTSQIMCTIVGDFSRPYNYKYKSGTVHVLSNWGYFKTDMGKLLLNYIKKMGIPLDEPVVNVYWSLTLREAIKTIWWGDIITYKPKGIKY